MSASVSFAGQVAVLVGAHGELGKQYARLLASRGARVVLGDVELSEDMLAMVDGIKQSGSSIDAVEDNSTGHADKAIKYALQAHGKIDVLFVLRAASNCGSSTTESEDVWHSSHREDVVFAFKTIRAAWPHFRKQKFGRIVIVSEIYDGANDILSTATRYALTGLTKTASQEGLKYNILCNMVAPTGGEFVQAVNLDLVVSLGLVLGHYSNKTEIGSVFVVDGSRAAKLLWQRSGGVVLKPNATLTTGVVLETWPRYFDFSQSSYPKTGIDFDPILKASLRCADSRAATEPNLSGRVVVITGAGAGLGRAYAEAFANLGASVVINDVNNPYDAVRDLVGRGKDVVGQKGSVEEGHKVIEKAIEEFGRIDILINNAGIVRDKSFLKMDNKSWDQVWNVHLRGSYATIRAVWPYMVKQKYGRIVNTTSVSGLYGNFGQANYSAAKAGIIGLSQACARAGAAHNIAVNTIAPAAGTDMSRSVMTEEMVNIMKPTWNAPFVVALCCNSNIPTPSGLIFETGLGWGATTRLRRTHGYDFEAIKTATPEHVNDVLTQVVQLEDENDTPRKGAKL